METKMFKSNVAALVLSLALAAAPSAIIGVVPALADASMDDSDLPQSGSGDSQEGGQSMARNDEGDGTELPANESETSCENENATASASRC
jgi:hypothetical protein